MVGGKSYRRWADQAYKARAYEKMRRWRKRHPEYSRAKRARARAADAEAELAEQIRPRVRRLMELFGSGAGLEGVA